MQSKNLEKLRGKIVTLLDKNRKFDLFIQFLIVVSLTSFSIETLPGLPDIDKKVLSYIESVTIIAFTLEYALRILTYKKRLKFIFSWWGLVDLVAILPYYLLNFLGFGIDLRAVRVLRLLRLVRVLKIFRNSAALKRMHRAFVLARDELLLFGGMSLVILYLAAVGIYYCENTAQPDNFSSIPHSLWWAIATLTTVGYGDVYPVTAWGKIWTGVVVMVGLGFIAMPASVMTAALSQARREEKEKKYKG